MYSLPDRSPSWPADRSLVRPEDGVMLGRRARYLIAEPGPWPKVALDAGRHEAAGSVISPRPATCTSLPSAAPDRNGLANGAPPHRTLPYPTEPTCLVADILTGAIYRINTETEQAWFEFISMNSAPTRPGATGSGAVWFTPVDPQPAPVPDSEARMFAAGSMKVHSTGRCSGLPPPRRTAPVNRWPNSSCPA